MTILLLLRLMLKATRPTTTRTMMKADWRAQQRKARGWYGKYILLPPPTAKKGKGTENQPPGAGHDGGGGGLWSITFGSLGSSSRLDGLGKAQSYYKYSKTQIYEQMCMDWVWARGAR
uniref:Putative secreted peptide n=1 Tax=Anopheles braziliensis TaxID=58242 RepID=A0A2M3ZWY6_9DIPT